MYDVFLAPRLYFFFHFKFLNFMLSRAEHDKGFITSGHSQSLLLIEQEKLLLDYFCSQAAPTFMRFFRNKSKNGCLKYFIIYMTKIQKTKNKTKKNIKISLACSYISIRSEINCFCKIPSNRRHIQ